MNLDWLAWGGFVLCLVLSFILSGMEAGVFALSRLRIRQQMRAGRPSAAVLHSFLEHPENFLWTILVGNTIANFLILGWVIIVLQRVPGQSRLVFIGLFALFVFLFFTFFDLLPKMLFRSYPNRLCLYLAHPFRLLHRLLGPLVALVESVSGALLKWRGGKAFTGYLFGNREELRLVMQESSQALSSEERAMINRVLDLQGLTVRQAMVPLAKVATVAPELPLSEVIKLAQARGFTRFPVREQQEGRIRIIGLLSLNRLLYEPELDMARPASDFVLPALFLEEDARLEVALRRMQRSGHRLAIVLSRDQREIGVISLQDVLKTLFGEVNL
jgi:CBS domain containing-hemolysin-like protein